MYDFRSLSARDFEELVRDLLQEELRVTFENFGPGPDQGIDFRFASATGHRIVVQAKHYVESGAASLVQAAANEREKVNKLNPDRYIFATSVSMNPTLKGKILEKLTGVRLVESDILGKEDLNNRLARHPSVERTHFKLWLSSSRVLERIIHSGIYNRTRTELTIIEKVVPKFVNNQSVAEAQRILNTHGSLIICGQPGVGKTTLARMLAWLHIEQEWNVLVIDDIKEAYEVAQEGEKRLIFFDDFLGQVSLSPDLIRSVDQRLPPFLEKVRASKDLRFILTTRDYILRQAQVQSERLSSVKIGMTELTLNVGHYTRSVKARLLYNHVYFSDVSQSDRSLLLQDDFFLNIIDHKNFNPRLIELLTSRDFLDLTGKPIREAISDNLENPQKLWEIPYREHISKDGQVLMLAVYFNGRLSSIDETERSFARKAGALGLNIHVTDLPSRFRRALRELEGSVIAIENRRISFGNPGLQDFLQRIVEEDRLIEFAISTATVCRELLQTWHVYNAIEGRPLTNDRAEELWTAAIKRLLDGDSGLNLSRFGLTMEVYMKFGGVNLEPLVVQATEELKESNDLDESDVDESQKLLAKLATGRFRKRDVVDEACDVLAEEMRSMLRVYGGRMSLDDIEAVHQSLNIYGWDSSGTAESSRAALENYLQDHDQALSELTSLDDLESYEAQLLELLEKFDIRSGEAEDKIEERRREIHEKRDRSVGSWRSVSSGGNIDRITSDEIRSMFSDLKPDD